MRYGYGIAQLHWGPNSIYFHGGETPGYNSFIGYDPTNQVTLVVWTQPDRIARRIADGQRADAEGARSNLLGVTDPAFPSADCQSLGARHRPFPRCRAVVLRNMKL